MTKNLRDLERRFIIAGRRYHVHIGRDDAPPRRRTLCEKTSTSRSLQARKVTSIVTSRTKSRSMWERTFLS